MPAAMLRWAAAIWAAAVLSLTLTGCWVFIGDPGYRNWVVEAYAPGETLEGVTAELERLAVRSGVVDLEVIDEQESYQSDKDLAPRQRHVQYIGRTMLDQVSTYVVAIDLRSGVGIRFQFGGDADDDDSMRIVMADLMRHLTDRFGPLNVAVKFYADFGESPGLLLTKWQQEEATR